MDEEEENLEYDEEHGPPPPREWRVIMAMRDPVAVVNIALGRHAVFKACATALEECPPDAGAARVLVEAHDRGAAPSWLVACLLGFNGHRDGYAKTLAILEAGDRLLSESYAASALVRIGGADALRDLVRVIDTTNDSRVRVAAAHAIAKLGSKDAIDVLRDAIARGRLRGRTMGGALARTAVPVETLLEDLRSPHRELRRWPAYVIHDRIRFSPQDARLVPLLATCAASGELRAALRAVIDEPDERVFESNARRMRAWLDSLDGPFV